MIPILQQMFVPAMGAAVVGAAGSDVFDPNAPKMAAQGTDATQMGDFAAVFVAQDVPTLAAKDPALDETTDISAEALIDAGAMIAELQPNSAALLAIDATMAPPVDAVMIAGFGPVEPSVEPSVLPDLNTALDVLDEVAGIQDTLSPIVTMDTIRPDATAVVPPKTATAQTAVGPDNIASDPTVGSVAEHQVMPQHTVVQQSVLQDVLAPMSQQIGQVPQILANFPTPMAISMAESMFQTQIDAQDGAMTQPIAVPPTVPPPQEAFRALAVLQSDTVLAQVKGTEVLPMTVAVQPMQVLKGPSSFTAKVDEGAGANVDVSTTAASVVSQDGAQDLAQNLVPSLGADRQPLAPKAEAVPLQNAQTPAALPNLPAPQLAAQILPHSHAAKTGPIEVLLNPAELGHLRFEIHQKGEHVQVVLSAERPETLDLLRRNGEQLAAEFRNSGFSGASLSFGQWGRSSDGQPPASFVANAEDDFSTVVLPPSAKPPMAQDNSRNLNLRL